MKKAESFKWSEKDGILAQSKEEAFDPVKAKFEI